MEKKVVLNKEGIFCKVTKKKKEIRKKKKTLLEYKVLLLRPTMEFMG